MIAAIVRDENKYDDTERAIIDMMKKAAENIPDVPDQEGEGDSTESDGNEEADKEPGDQEED